MASDELQKSPNVPSSMPATLSFRFIYSRKYNTIIVEDIKAGYLPVRYERRNVANQTTLFVRFEIAGLRCDTSEKVAWREELIHWDERLEFNDVEEKNLKADKIKAKFIDVRTKDIVSRVTLPFSEVELMERLLICIPLEPVVYGEFNQGQLFFFLNLIGENEGLKLSHLKATHLYQKFNHLCARCRLLPFIAEENGTKTEEKPEPEWNDELTITGTKLMDHQLNIQLLGPSHHGVREVAGEVNISSEDVSKPVDAIYLPLVMCQLGKLNFSSIYSSEKETLVFKNISCEGLVNVHAKGMINPFIEVQQLKSSRLLRVYKTKPVSSTQYPVFTLTTPLSFNLGSDEHAETEFKFTVMSKRTALSKKIRVIGALVVGPLSQGQWSHLVRTQEKEVQHTYRLNEVDDPIVPN